MTCIAWNHAVEDPFMFATGSHDGGVRIWTQPEEDPPDTDEDENGAVPVRSASPFDMERTDSPLTQAEFDAIDALRQHDSTARRQNSLRQDSLTTTSEFSVTTPRERTVTFGQSDES
jgi:hypothetical protein